MAVLRKRRPPRMRLGGTDHLFYRKKYNILCDSDSYIDDIAVLMSLAAGFLRLRIYK
jgi:hypothetical protein